jgi:hypothetical protein
MSKATSRVIQERLAGVREFPFEPTARLNLAERACFDLIVSTRPTFEWMQSDRLLITRLARWFVQSEKWHAELKGQPLVFIDAESGRSYANPGFQILDRLDSKIERATKALELAGSTRLTTLIPGTGAQRYLMHNIQQQTAESIGDDEASLLA